MTYHYNVTLRVWHPTTEPAEITRLLRLDPKHAYVVGQQLVRAGKQIDRVATEMYWTHEFETSDTPIDVEAFLLETARSLLPRRDSLVSIRSSGGRSELFVGFFPEDFNCGFELSPELQGVCAELGLALSFDVYAIPADEA